MVNAPKLEVTKCQIFIYKPTLYRPIEWKLREQGQIWEPNQRKILKFIIPFNGGHNLAKHILKTEWEQGIQNQSERCHCPEIPNEIANSIWI